MSTLTERFPTTSVEDVYTPSMMQYDGSTGYYSDTSLTTSGNKVSGVFKFKRSSFTGDVYETLATVSGGTWVRWQALVVSSNHSTLTNRQGKLQVDVQNSSGTSILKLISSTTVLDGEEHTCLFSFDGDTGVATFTLDGVDADDTGNADRIAPTTGTLDTGTGWLYVGSDTTNDFGGSIGFFGHDEQYLTTYSNFFDSNNKPIKQDENGWTNSGWGSQPLFWNEFGFMEDNKGSAGDMTKNGTIDLTSAEVTPTGFINYPFQIKDVYTPSMIKYDGTSTRYTNGTVTTSGNLLTVVFRFACDSRAGTGARFLLVSHSGTINTRRIAVAIGDASHSTVPNKLQIFAKNSAGTNLFEAYTTADITDGEVHSVLCAIDTDTGAGVFIVDGEEITPNTATTGTLNSGSQTFNVGDYADVPDSEYSGYMGYLGYIDDYIGEYSAFFDASNLPIKQNENWASSGFGAQPTLFNEHGCMFNNKGSAGSFSQSGPVTLSDEEVVRTGFNNSPRWDDTVTGNETLLLNFNGTDGATSTTDEAKGATVTFGGDAQLDTAISKFGSASLILDGTGDYISLPYVAADFDWWTGDYTIDGWVYASSFADWSFAYFGINMPLLIGNRNHGEESNYWSFGPTAAGTLVFYYWTGARLQIVSSAVTLPTSEWVHVAMQHVNGTVQLFMNGSLIGSGEVTGTPLSNPLYTLSIGGVFANYMTGQVDALRITKGTARYTPPTLSDFNVPTQEPSA